MKELADYTDDELREELKRRAMYRRANTPREINYVEFEATIKSVDNIRSNHPLAIRQYKPFAFWKYRLSNCSIDIANKHEWNDYYLKQGVFKKDNAPKLGDRVKLRYRRTKKQKEVFDLNKAKIIEIINNN